MRAFQDERSKFGGSYRDNFDITLEMYDTITVACGVTIPDKRVAMIFRLNGKAAQLFNSNAKRCRTYEEAELSLRRRYKNRDKCDRILSQWQSLRLSEEFAKIPNASGRDVFLYFT